MLVAVAEGIPELSMWKKRKKNTVLHAAKVSRTRKTAVSCHLTWDFSLLFHFIYNC
jgi:hypothetical protein